MDINGMNTYKNIISIQKYYCLLFAIALLILSPERRSHSWMAASSSADVELGSRFITESEIDTIKIAL